jgi:hypothetical protein
MNRPAEDCGVRVGMRVKEAAKILLEKDPESPEAAGVTHRTVMEEGPNGRKIICTDSIAFGLPEDDKNVLLTAGHTGRSAVEYLHRCRPLGFICSDGGKGREDSGVAGIYIVEADGLAGGTVDAHRARMGDGFSTWYDGIMSAVNRHAAAAGVKIGMTAQEAARLLVNRKA